MVAKKHFCKQAFVFLRGPQTRLSKRPSQLNQLDQTCNCGSQSQKLKWSSDLMLFVTSPLKLLIHTSGCVGRLSIISSIRLLEICRGPWGILRGNLIVLLELFRILIYLEYTQSSELNLLRVWWQWIWNKWKEAREVWNETNEKQMKSGMVSCTVV